MSPERSTLDALREILEVCEHEQGLAVSGAVIDDIERIARDALTLPPPADALRDRLLALLMQDKSPPLPNGIVLIQHYFAGTAVKLHEEGTTCVICAALSTSEEGAR